MPLKHTLKAPSQLDMGTVVQRSALFEGEKDSEGFQVGQDLETPYTVPWCNCCTVLQSNLASVQHRVTWKERSQCAVISILLVSLRIAIRFQIRESEFDLLTRFRVQTAAWVVRIHG